MDLKYAEQNYNYALTQKVNDMAAEIAELKQMI